MDWKEFFKVDLKKGVIIVLLSIIGLINAKYYFGCIASSFNTPCSPNILNTIILYFFVAPLLPIMLLSGLPKYLELVFAFVVFLIYNYILVNVLTFIYGKLKK